jgi:hypothetical protein
MNEIETLLTEKLNTQQQLKRQIEALRRSAAMLAEPGLAGPSAQPPSPLEVPAIVTAVAEAVERADAAAEPAVRPEAPPRCEPVNAAKSGVPSFVRFSTAAQIFPPAQEGMIVCDLCGHRNPDYLLDCERCDLPIRLRP